MTVEALLQSPFAKEYPKLAANPKGFPELARKVIALQQAPMAWESDVKALKVPVLIIGGPKQSRAIVPIPIFSSA
jgi:hypothetical protein